MVENAATPVTNSNASVRFACQPGEFVGHEQVVRQRIRAGTSEFIFLMPSNVRMEALDESAIVMNGPQMKYWVSVRFLRPVQIEGELKSALRSRTESQYSSAGEKDDFVVTVAGREGAGIQFRQDLPSTGERFVRIVWVPFQAGIMEFVLNSDSRQAAVGQRTFDAVLLTFHSNEEGTLIIPERHEQS
jgi:hypothetical protein